MQAAAQLSSVGPDPDLRYVDVDSLACRMKCENGADRGMLDIEAFCRLIARPSACAYVGRYRSRSIGCQ
ncbi:hypothetical protein MPLB_1870064 [Mesorhizobium sp. ORS 3324]|nr:hypothetical protein MPLB_1870064 [Mesorhizobium sp. ORS 3324]